MNVRAGPSEAGGKGLIAPLPDFGRTVNPIPIKDRIIPTKLLLPLGFSDLSTTLECTYFFKEGSIKT